MLNECQRIVMTKTGQQPYFIRALFVFFILTFYCFTAKNKRFTFLLTYLLSTRKRDINLFNRSHDDSSGDFY